MDYQVNITGTVCDKESNFKCGFDITVMNGANVKQVGSAVQEALDRVAPASKK